MLIENSVVKKYKKEISVSVVVLNYNGKDYLKNCIDSLVKVDEPKLEIIIVDNASTDGSEEIINQYIHRYKGKVFFIKNERNMGIAEGYNIGIRNSRHEYIVILNSDTIVKEDSLKKIIEPFFFDRKVAAVQPKILKPLNNSLIDSVGADMDVDGCLVETYYLQNEKNCLKANVVREIPFPTSVASAYRKEILVKVGLFDSMFSANYEDVDLGWRLRRRGYKIVFYPMSIIYHARGGTTSKYPLLTMETLYRHRLLFILKHYSILDIVKAMPAIMLLYLFTFIVNCLARNIQRAFVPIHAISWILLNFREIINKRRLELHTHGSRTSIKELMKFSSYGCLTIRQKLRTL